MNDVEWELYISDCCDVDTCYDNFISVLDFISSSFVPASRKRVGNSKKNKKKKHFPSKIRKMLARKLSAWRKLKKRGTRKRKEIYQALAKKCKSLMDANELAEEESILRNRNLSKFYRHVNSKLSSKSGVGPLKK